MLNHHWLTYSLASAFFAAFVAIFAKIGLAHIPTNMATLLRTLVIAVFLVILISIRGEWINRPAFDAKSLIFIVLSGLATGLSWVCYFQALQRAPASLVAPIDKLSVLFAVLLAVVFLGEHLSWLQWGGVVLMTCGALLVVLK